MRYLSFVISFPSFPFTIFMGQAWVDGRGKLATSCHRADSGEETVKMYAAIVEIGFMRVSINKKKILYATTANPPHKEHATFPPPL
jgi:hypothetical protein